jgi:peptidoglycan/xylan/chitin deacetylase (PgdA/CDA1 family)
VIHRLKQLARKAQRIIAKRNPRRVEIVLYHFVTDTTNPFITSGHNVTPAEFAKQLDYLQQNYEVIPLEAAPNAVRERTKFDKPLVSICFDDGYQSNLTEALPILRERGIPATIFVCPSVLGNAGLLWRDEVRYLIDQGLEDEFVAFLKAGDTSSCYQFESLNAMPFYRWSKSTDGITDMTIQADLKRFFVSKSIDTAAMAAEHDLFISPDDIHPNHDGLAFGNHDLVASADAAARRRWPEKPDREDRCLAPRARR